MSPQTGSVIVCLLLAHMDAVPGLHFVMDRHPDNYFCGHLQCFADITHSDRDILTLVAMTIYDITRVNVELKLVSVSTFHPDPYVGNTKSSAMSCTGIISRHQANLTVQLRNDIDCLYGVYKCQVDVVTVSGHSEVLTEIVTPEQNKSYSRIGEMIRHLDRLTELLNSHTTHVNHQTAQINSLADHLRNQTAQINSLKGQFDDQTAGIIRLTTQLVNQKSQLTDQTTLLNNLSVRIDLQKSEQKQRYEVTGDRLQKLEAKVDTCQQLSNQVSEILDDQATCNKGQPHRRETKRVNLWGNVPAVCDMTTAGGQWIIIQRRTKGDVDFYKGWSDYKNGFGTPDTDFWIGNDVIHNLTSEGLNELRIDLIYQGRRYYAHYSNFYVASESSDYQLSVSGYSGTAGDSFIFHSNMYFSTFDRDNDKITFNCANMTHGAWWYKGCHESNLNGQWGSQGHSGLVWKSITGSNSVSFTEMKIRRV